MVNKRNKKNNLKMILGLVLLVMFGIFASQSFTLTQQNTIFEKTVSCNDIETTIEGFMFCENNNYDPSLTIGDETIRVDTLPVNTCGTNGNERDINCAEIQINNEWYKDGDVIQFDNYDILINFDSVFFNDKEVKGFEYSLGLNFNQDIISITESNINDLKLDSLSVQKVSIDNDLVNGLPLFIESKVQKSFFFDEEFIHKTITVNKGKQTIAVELPTDTIGKHIVNRNYYILIEDVKVLIDTQESEYFVSSDPKPAKDNVVSSGQEIEIVKVTSIFNLVNFMILSGIILIIIIIILNRKRIFKK